MFQKLFVVFFFCFIWNASAQIINQGGSQLRGADGRYLGERDTTRVNTDAIEVQLSGETKFTDYKIISYKRDTTYIDTTLNIGKDYIFNYREKDNLELMAFANQGQTFNHLAYDFKESNLFPKIGARAKHFGFYEVEDIYYYQVPTPTTELMYKTGLEQGQVLNALFTFNTSKRLNASIAFKGIRSLGKYRNSLSDLGNLRATLSYNTKNDKYFIRTHLVSQDVNNDENGGLTPESIENFESGDPNFKDRNRLVTNFTDATSYLRGNRYFIDHYYYLWKKNDSTKTIPSQLKIGHTLNYERKHFDYEQESANDMFGNAFNSNIEDHLRYTKFYNQAYVALNSPITLGEVRFKVQNFNYSYSYNSVVIKPGGDIIDSSLNGNSFAIGGEWHTQFKKFNLTADASTIVSGDLYGYEFSGSASFVKDSVISVKATIFNRSSTPNFNFLLNQSTYKAYNWENNFENELKAGLAFELDAHKWGNASVYLTNISNYTYFDAPDTDQQTKAVQATEDINYLKIKLSKEFRFGKFALDNQFIYQNVSKGSTIFRVPDFVTRNTFYFSSYLFKGKPLFLQTGVTFNYFSQYYMNNYNPVIQEFYLQNDQKYGGYPMFDFFINAKVRTMRIYFKIQHFNSSFGEYNYYSAPTYPYRDLTFRFGIKWNFFI